MTTVSMGICRFAIDGPKVSFGSAPCLYVHDARSAANGASSSGAPVSDAPSPPVPSPPPSDVPSPDAIASPESETPPPSPPAAGLAEPPPHAATTLSARRLGGKMRDGTMDRAYRGAAPHSSSANGPSTPGVASGTAKYFVYVSLFAGPP